MNIDMFGKYACPGKHAHLVGIGGVSMSPLAEVLGHARIKVTGSDISDSPSVETSPFARHGGIDRAHSPENILGADFVNAPPPPETTTSRLRLRAKRRYRCLSGAKPGAISCADIKNALCISGTHGKTTTTSMANGIY
jgi:UDP-N-acetylmuramate--alanine ligase